MRSLQTMFSDTQSGNSFPSENEQGFWLAHKVKQEVDPAWTDPRVTTKAARASVVGTHPHQE
jgi:hypothetical protein